MQSGVVPVIQKPSFFHSLLQPCVVIAIPIKNDPFVIPDGLTERFMKRSLKIPRLLQPVRIELQRTLPLHCSA